MIPRRIDPAVRDINNHPQFPVMLTPRQRSPTQRLTIGHGTHEISQESANSREAEVQQILESPDSLIPFRPRRRRRLNPPNFHPRENYMYRCLHCHDIYFTHFFHTTLMHAHCAKKVICNWFMKYVFPEIPSQNSDNMTGYFNAELNVEPL